MRTPFAVSFCRTWTTSMMIGAVAIAPLARVSAADAQSCGFWSQVAAAQPVSRDFPAMILDPLRGRIVEFGGLLSSYDPPLNDLWSFSLATDTWSPLAANGTPPSGRYNAAAVYDPVRDRMLVLGGGGASDRIDVWSLSLSGTPTWTAITPSGTPPSDRFGSGIVYDSVHDRLLVFGGSISTTGLRSQELWELTLAGSPAWHLLSVPGAPPARYSHAAAYDPVRDRMLVFGGSGVNAQGSVALGDLWAFEAGGTPHWVALTPQNGLPPASNDVSASYDVSRDRMIVFENSGGHYRWAVSLRYDPVSVNLAPAGSDATLGNYVRNVYDPAGNRLFVIDGHCCNSDHGTWLLRMGLGPDVAVDPLGAASVTRSATPCDSTGGTITLTANPIATYYLDHWSGDAAGDANPLVIPADHYRQITGHFVRRSTPDTCGRWSFVTTTGAPPARTEACRILDPSRQRLVMFGGRAAGGSALGDLWEYSLATRSWAPLAAAGTPPSPRYGASAVYDPNGDRMLVLGGNATNAPSFTEVWSLSFGGAPTWSKLALSGGPHSRMDAATIYDPVRLRVVMFGGLQITCCDNGELWQLALDSAPAWSPLAAVGAAPQTRTGAGAIYDPLRDRMVLFGGMNFNYPVNTVMNDLWTLSLSTLQWTAITPQGGSPPPRELFTFVYDGPRDRIVVHGGSQLSSYLSDTWQFALANGFQTTSLTASAGTAPGARPMLPAVYDAPREQILTFGNGITGGMDDAYHMPLGVHGGCSATAVDDAAGVTAALAIARVRWGSDRREGVVTVSLASRAPAMLELFDVAGRRWARRTLAGAPGEQQVRLAATQPLGPGVYFLRLLQDGRAGAARFIMLR